MLDLATKLPSVSSREKPKDVAEITKVRKKWKKQTTEERKDLADGMGKEKRPRI